MNNLKDNPRKTNLWQLLSAATGYSKSYCQKVIKSERNPHAKGGKIIMIKYNKLQKFLSHD